MKTSVKDFDSQMLSAVSKTLENMVFSPTEEAMTVWARLDALEPLKGEFALVFPEGLAREVAAGLHGVEAAELPERTVLDCTAEILNIIAGQFLESVLPSDVEFSLGIPLSGIGTRFDFPAGMRSYTFKIDEKTFMLAVSTGLMAE